MPEQRSADLDGDGDGYPGAMDNVTGISVPEPWEVWDNGLSVAAERPAEKKER